MEETIEKSVFEEIPTGKIYTEKQSSPEHFWADH